MDKLFERFVVFLVVLGVFTGVGIAHYIIYFFVSLIGGVIS